MMIEDLLPQAQQLDLHDTIMGKYFPWYCHKVVDSAPDNELLQMVHILYEGSQIISEPYWPLAMNVLMAFQQKSGIMVKEIQRVKVNFLPRLHQEPKWLDNIRHIDHIDDSYISMIYYVNDSDGDTTFYEDNIVSSVTPKKNSCTWFKSNIMHRSSVPVINNRRVVINYVLKV